MAVKPAIIKFKISGKQLGNMNHSYLESKQVLSKPNWTINKNNSKLFKRATGKLLSNLLGGPLFGRPN